MWNEEKVADLLSRFHQKYPDPRPALFYGSAYELLIAVILSAQCTDERVNRVTATLFPAYDTPEKMVALTPDELGQKIYSCGLYRAKAEHILSASHDIIARFGGQVPGTIEELRTLAGVGEKTANVVYSVWFGGAAIAVDTHVFRVANRMGLSHSTNPSACGRDLRKILPSDSWSRAHHYLIFHGRQVCSAKKPNCEHCFLSDLCEKNLRK